MYEIPMNVYFEQEETWNWKVKIAPADRKHLTMLTMSSSAIHYPLLSAILVPRLIRTHFRSLFLRQSRRYAISMLAYSSNMDFL